jgi:hypothetical protein
MLKDHELARRQGEDEIEKGWLNKVDVSRHRQILPWKFAQTWEFVETRGIRLCKKSQANSIETFIDSTST